MKKWIDRAQLYCAILGLLMITIMLITHEVCPRPLFQIVMLLGLGLIFLSLLFMVLNWLIDVRNAVKRRRPLEVGILVICAAITLYLFFAR